MTMKLLDNVWVEKSAYAKAERLYYEKLAKKGKQVKSDNDSLQTNGVGPGTGSIAKEVAKARQQIKESLKSVHSGIIGVTDSDMSQNIVARLQSLEVENKDLKKTVEDLRKLVSQLSITVKSVEERLPASSVPVKAPTPVAPVSKKDDDDDDDVDLFGSGSEGEDAERERIKQERVAAYAAKKSKKPVLIAKSNIILDIKPWDDETDMAKLEQEVRKIEMDGLLWGAGKLVPLAYGIHKLQISCVVEDEKVSVDLLTEQLEAIEDYVQSVDIAAFNKI